MSIIKTVFQATIIIIILTVTTAVADWFEGDGHKMHFPQLPDENGVTIRSSPAVMIADDWQCSETGEVRDIHFWGAWKGDLEGDLMGFRLTIYSDIPADPQTSPHSKPGQLLWQQEIPISMVMVRSLTAPEPQNWYDFYGWEHIYDDHQQYYQYNVFLPEELYFYQEQDSIYWLEVVPYLADPEGAEWGWQSSDYWWNDGAVYYDPELQIWRQLHQYFLTDVWDYIPGDVNGDGVVTGADPVYFNSWQIGIGPPPPFMVQGVNFYAAADANGDCAVNAGDMAYLISYLEGGGPAPGYCVLYPPLLDVALIDMAFVINGGPPICDCNPGDANGDGQVNVGDPVYIINYVFKGGPAPSPYSICSGDANGDCITNVGDAVYLINWMWCTWYPCPKPVDCETWLENCGEPLRR